MRLRTPRLTLSRVGVNDLKALVDLFAHEPVYRYLCDGVAPSRQLLESWIEKSDALFAAHGVGLYVARQGTDTIGLTGFFEFHDPPSLEFLFALRPSCVGHGFANEMGRAMMPLGVRRFGRVGASTDAPNSRSIAALERIGFGETRRVRHPGAQYETVYFEFPASTARHE